MRILKTLAAVIMLAGFAFGQAQCRSSLSAYNTGNYLAATPHASLEICNTAGAPCGSPTSTSQLWKDAAETQPLTNPFTSDANGNYQWCSVSGTYFEQVTWSAQTLVNTVTFNNASWPSGGAGIPNYSGSSSYGTTYSASNTIPASFISTLNQATTGNAATATALASTPSLCSTGYAPQGVLPSGNATGCVLISSGSGLPVTMIYEPAGTSLSTLQTAINGASPGTEFELSGTYSGICGLTITGSGIRLRGMNEYSTTFTCAAAATPNVTVSGSGLNGFEMSGITVQHITNTPTCGGGPGTSTCGDGIQILGGASRVKLEHDHFNFNYDNAVLGYSTYSEVINSEFEYAQGDNVYFLMDPTHTTMQWQFRGGLAEQALGNGVNMTCPNSFSSVQSTAPTFMNNFTVFGNVGYGFKFSCSGATTSGIADIILDGVTATTNNNSNIYLDPGPSGGRNALVRCILCELAGQDTVGAGFAQTTQSASGVGDGVTITSSCDATTPPNIGQGQYWENSDAGVNTACAGTKISEGDYFHNGLAGGATATLSDVEVQASNVSITSNYFRNTTNGIYVVSGDTPSAVGNVADASVTNYIAYASFPTNSFQQWIGVEKIITGISTTPPSTCSINSVYFNSIPTSASTAMAICYPANNWTFVTAP